MAPLRAAVAVQKNIIIAPAPPTLLLGGAKSLHPPSASIGAAGQCDGNEPLAVGRNRGRALPTVVCGLRIPATGTSVARFGTGRVSDPVRLQPREARSRHERRRGERRGRGEGAKAWH